MHSYLIQFAKLAQLQFISHLDLMSAWNYVLRRSLLPLRYSEGFNPHPRFAIIAPLEVGITSDCELLEVQLQTAMDSSVIYQQLSAVLPQGITIYKVTPLYYEPRQHPSARVHSLSYSLTCRGITPEEVEVRKNSQQDIIRQHPRKKPRTFSVADELLTLHTVPEDKSCRIDFTLRRQNTGSLRASEIAHQLLAIPPENIIQFSRTKIGLNL